MLQVNEYQMILQYSPIMYVYPYYPIIFLFQNAHTAYKSISHYTNTITDCIPQYIGNILSTMYQPIYMYTLTHQPTCI